MREIRSWDILTVTAVEDASISVTDSQGKPIRISTQRNHRWTTARPRLNERWIGTRSYGEWTFLVRVDSRPTAIADDHTGGPAVTALLQRLEANGEITWSGSETTPRPAFVDHGSLAAASKTITWTEARTQKITLTQNTLFGIASQVSGEDLVMDIIAGANTVTWGAALKWDGGTPPVLTGNCVVGFECSGNVVIGRAINLNYS